MAIVMTMDDWNETHGKFMALRNQGYTVRVSEVDLGVKNGQRIARCTASARKQGFRNPPDINCLVMAPVEALEAEQEG